MISEAHLLDPGVLSTITKPSSAVTNCASPLFAKAIAHTKTHNLVPKVTKKLKAFAQHRSQKPQEIPQSREEGSSQISHLGTSPAHGNPTHCDNPHRELSTQPAPPNRSDHLDNSTVFQRGQCLLRHPVVNHIEDLGGLCNRPMGDASSGPPDPPWFAKPSASGIPIIMGQDSHGRQFKLPYMRYGLVENEPLLLETSGRNQQIYGDHLRAFSMPVLPFTTNVDDSALEELYMNYPFNWTMNLALYQIGDAGVLADVYRYRTLYLKLQYMRQENARLTCMLLMIQKEQEAHNEEINNFVNDVVSIRECLTDARVMSRLVPAYRQLAV